MRIAHFSDIHAFVHDFQATAFFDKRLLGTFNHFFRRSKDHHWDRVHNGVAKIKCMEPDIVIFTGDLATLSSPKEFDLACQALKPLVEDTSFEFLIVPGNHDFYVHSQKCIDALEKSIYYLSRNRWKLYDFPMKFPYMKCEFFLLNQANPAPPWASNGYLDAQSISFVENELENNSDNIKVLVSHYPLYDQSGMELNWRRKCKGNDILLNAFDHEFFRLALCGHIHSPFVRPLTAKACEICAGSLNFNGVFNFMDLNILDGSLNQQWIFLDETGKGNQQTSTVQNLVNN
ncbi:MAG: metallophosphoesterase [Lentisphaeria bacterium]|nr:metallophosphoesterase [Lentisphaeria bacterium]